MKYSCLGSSGTRISRLTLGTMMFGSHTSEEDSLKIMDCAVDNGINVFDTADVYNGGESERIVGKGLKGRRDQIILATKVFYPVTEGINNSGLSRGHIIQGVEDSLKRLETDYIDIYYMHSPDYNTSLEESLEAMDSLVKSGKIRYIGVSNYAAWQISDILAVCDKHNFVAPVITENVYNLLTRGIEEELLPCTRTHKIAMTAYNPLAAGLLSGKYNDGNINAGERFSQHADYRQRYWMDSNLKAVKNLADLAGDHGMTLIELAMKWIDAQEGITSIITGVSKLSHMEQNVKLLDGDALPEEVLQECDAIWKEISGSRYSYNR